jgi:hypothetical protein
MLDNPCPEEGAPHRLSVCYIRHLEHASDSKVNFDNLSDVAKAADTPTPRKKAAPVAKTGGMSADHKQALAQGREEGRAIRQYLEALEAHRPRRGRKRTSESIQMRLETIDMTVDDADPLTRVHLLQERMDLEAELGQLDETFDLSVLEDAFIQALPGYSQRKGLSYTAWREVGIDAQTLKRAGIPRTRSTVG